MLTIYNGHYRTPAESGVRHFIQLEIGMLAHLREFTCSELMVMVSLGLHIDQRGYCFPSVSRLQEVTGLTAPTIRTAIKGLTEKQIEMKPVLLMRERKAATGRQTSNEYILFPQDDNAFDIIDEGVKVLPVTSKNLVPLEQEPNKLKKRKSNALPELDDPAYLLWIAFNDTLNPFGDHNLLTGEWMSVKFILYQMHKQGVTPEKISESTTNLVSQWGAEYVTIHSLWKHWAKAQAPAAKPRKPRAATTVEQAESAMSIMARVNNLLGGGND